MSDIELTILMPCLNEAETLAACIQTAKNFLQTAGIRGEVLIADNGSTDGSQAIADQHQARLVTTSTRGYGAALKCGIDHAAGKYIIMGDADCSYDFLHLMPFIDHLRTGSDLVMGNRFQGGIQKGAMPFLNRYLGNPVLSFIGRLFFNIPIGDFHCGLRGFHRDTIRALGLKSDGMEFASEMVVAASLQALKIREVPTTLMPDGRSRRPHLRPWRDGCRHLKLLLAMKWAATQRHDSLILLLSLMGCGLIALLIGRDLNWDFANYHYYNAYAYLHQRWLYDFWPASYTHVNFSPTADLLNYFLINYFPAPMTIFLSGAIQGLNVWLLYKIARLFLQDRPPAANLTWLAFAFALLGLYQPLVVMMLGSFLNDMLVSIFTLSFFYLTCLWLQRYALTQRLSRSIVGASGLLLGMGFGLKFTQASFVLGGMAAIVLLPIVWRDKLKASLLVGCCVGLGLLLSNGYWMWNLWERFHNPFYPFLSHFWHGDTVHHIVMGDFTPKNWRERLLFPFYESKDGSGRFREYQFALVAILFLLSVGMTFIRKRLREAKQSPNLLIWWFYSFFIISYVVWENYFGVSRYVRALAMLSPLLMFVILHKTLRVAFWLSFIFAFTATVITFTPLLTYMRVPFVGADYFNLRLPAFVSRVPSALVLITFPEYAVAVEPRPQSYLIPFFPPAWHFVGVPMAKDLSTVWEPSELLLVKKMIAQQSAPIYMLTGDVAVKNLYAVATRLGLRPDGVCEHIYNDRLMMTHQPTLICPLVKIT